jgi:hypothetical protein
MGLFIVPMLRRGNTVADAPASWFGVAVATACFNAGSRTGKRVTFLCLAKEKSPKERPPGIPP